MKNTNKIVLLISSLFLLSSCEPKVQPIEKYKGKGYVIIEELLLCKGKEPFDYGKIRLKSKDSLFIIYVPLFDAKNLKIGDTL